MTVNGASNCTDGVLRLTEDLVSIIAEELLNKMPKGNDSEDRQKYLE